MGAVAVAVALCASAVMAVCAVLLLHRFTGISLIAVLVTGALAILCSAALAGVTGLLPVWVAAAIASGALPVAVPLIAITHVPGESRVTTILAAAVWGVVVVPFATVAPQLPFPACGAPCTVEDFGGGLPLVIGVGAFLVVPSTATIGRNRMHSGTGWWTRDLVLLLLFWLAFTVWLSSLEGDIDEYTGRIALAAVAGPAAGAVGWFVADRVRGVGLTPLRALRVGLLAGMGGVLAGTVALTSPWIAALGLVCGAVGALTHDARGMQSSPPATRAAVAALVVGAVGMLAPGIVGSTLGAIFAARVDVLIAQVLSTVAVAIVGVIASVPVAVLLRRTSSGTHRAAVSEAP